MKNLISSIVLLIVLLNTKAIAQEFYPLSVLGSLGAALPTQKNTEVDFVLGGTSSFGLQYDIKISQSNALRVGVAYEQFRFINDGYFTKDDAGKSIFTNTPNTYQNNYQQMVYVAVPIAWVMKFPDERENYELALVVQPSYQVQNLHFYKENGQKFREDAQSNPWRYAVGLEYAWYPNRIERKAAMKYAVCFNYQINSFVEQGRAFIPLVATLKGTFLFVKK